MAMGAAVRDLERVFTTGTVTGLTEGQLLDRFVHRGDEAAFEALVTRHGPMVMGVCRRILRDPNDVEDAFQATFLVLVRKAKTLRHSELLGNWLYGVATKVALQARTMANRRRTLEFSKEGAEPAAKPEVPNDENQTLHEEVRKLPEKYRAAVVLCYLEGLTHEQAAERLEWPVGTVKGRLSRARDLLKARLVRRGVALSGPLAVAELLQANAQAAVPTTLVQNILKASALAAAGKPMVAGALSAQAIALTEGVLTAMSFTKIKIAAGTIALAGTFFASAAVYAYQGFGLAPAVDPPAAKGGGGAASGAPAGLAATVDPAIPFENQQGGRGGAGSGGGAAPATQPAQPVAGGGGRGAMGGGGNMPGMGGMGGMGMGGGFGGAEGTGAARAKISRIRAVIAEASPKIAELDKTPASQAILKKLDAAVDLNFPEDTPLADVLKYIKDATLGDSKTPIPIYVDPTGLADAEQTLTSPITISLDGVPLKTSLRLLLKQIGLAYCVKEGLLIISSPEGILDELREFESAHVDAEQRIIPQPGLLNAPGGMGGGGMGGMMGGMGGGGGFGGGMR